jgi:hypothetical protein
MAIKIDNQASISFPSKTEQIINSALDVIPREHLRGLNRVVLVDFISPQQQRVQIPNASELPGMYHPRIGTEQPYFEIALGVLLPSSKGFFQKLAARLNYKVNLIGLVHSLQAQHYHLTFSHGVKKHQYEKAIRSYMEKYFEVWREKNGGWRARAFKPFKPYLERWSKKLRKRYEEEKRTTKK